MANRKINFNFIGLISAFFVGLFYRNIAEAEVADISKFVYSNLFGSIVTIIIGSLAYYLYIRQQRDYKMNAARLIVQEIRYAGQQIENAQKTKNGYYLATRLLPTNNWDSNIHLFVQYLEPTQIDIISEFYARAAFLDKLIGIIGEEKGKILLETLGGVENATECVFSSGVKYPKESNVEFNASYLIDTITKEMKPIYNTPVVEKLKSIADGNF